MMAAHMKERHPERRRGAALLHDSPYYGCPHARDTPVTESCGGGGYGPPAERDVERVRRDAIEGRVSGERAAEVDGVGVGESDEIDQAATATRRSTLAEAA